LAKDKTFEKLLQGSDFKSLLKRVISKRRRFSTLLRQTSLLLFCKSKYGCNFAGKGK